MLLVSQLPSSYESSPATGRAGPFGIRPRCATKPLLKPSRPRLQPLSLRSLSGTVHERNRQAALAHGRSDALDRAGANVAARKDARHARLEEVAIAVEVPIATGTHVRSGEHVAVPVECELGWEPARLGVCTDEQEQPAGLESRRLARVRVADVDRFEICALCCDHLCPVENVDIGSGSELV